MTARKSQATAEQSNQLLEIGSQLRQIRRQQNLSVEAVAQRTRIRVSLIRAIEAGELLVLPQTFYTKELIRKYAYSLGVDGDYYAELFDPQKSVDSPTSFVRPVLFPRLRTFHLYVLYIVVVAVAVNTLSHWLQRPRWQTTETNTPVAEINHSSQVINVQSEAQPLVVEIKLEQQSWLEVVADGQVVFQGDLIQGSHRTWMAQNQLTIRAANAGGVLVEFNNQVQPLGEPGQVQEVTYTLAQGED